MPSSGSDKEQLYCVCKSSDGSRFMIACDHCEDWFHGDCVNITEKESRYIKKYFCPECVKRNPNLKIVHKSSYESYLREKRERREKERSKDRPKEHRKGSSSDAQHRHHKEKHKHRHRDRPHHHHHHHRHKHKRDRSEDDSSNSRREKKRKKKEKHREKEKQRERDAERARDREEVVAGTVPADAAGGGEKKKYKKIERTFSTDSSRSSSKASGNSGEPRHPSPPPTSTSTTVKPSQATSQQPQPQQQQQAPVTPSPHRPYNKHAHKKNILKDAVNQASPPKPLRTVVSDDTEEDRNNLSDDKDISSGDHDSDAWEPPQPVLRAVQAEKKARVQPSKKRKNPSQSLPRPAKRRRGYRGIDSDCEDDNAQSNYTPTQCLNPPCVEVARLGSKYCSDKCGLTLAELRITKTLPDRIREWNSTTCAADERSMKELEKIRNKENQLKAHMSQLQLQFQQLEDVIAKGKGIGIDEDKDEDDDEGETTEMTVHCVTCGADIATKTAIRHMERCYNKMESQTSFASKYKTQIDDQRLFCDNFNRKDQTYCKRLKVLCPEHNPDPKIGENEVCAYPINKELFGKPTEFCRRAKKKCHQHYCWEKLRRAEIDMEKVRLWMKVDELLEQERQVKAALSNRAGVLGLMLHSTFNHDIANRNAQVHAHQQLKVKHQQPKIKV